MIGDVERVSSILARKPDGTAKLKLYTHCPVIQYLDGGFMTACDECYSPSSCNL